MESRKYRYDRYYLETPDDRQATVGKLVERLFRPNVETPNNEILATERRRMVRLMERFGIPFDAELFGYDWDELCHVESKLQGMVYNHVPIVLPDLWRGEKLPTFVDCTPLPEDIELPDDMDVFASSMTTMRFVKERPDWVTRYGLLNQRRMGQTVLRPEEQDAVRTGFWMIPEEVLKIAFEADPELARRAFHIFGQVQFAEGHDGFFHMPIHGIYFQNPHYQPLRGWSDLLYDVPPEIQYPNGESMPNYEMTAVRSHRKMFQRALGHNPAIADILINYFVEFEETVERLASGIADTELRGQFVTYMMTLFKTPFFHVIPPDSDDPRLMAIKQKHPCVTKNNKMMRALHERDTVHTTKGEIPVEEVIEEWRALVIPYARQVGILPQDGTVERTSVGDNAKNS